MMENEVVQVMLEKSNFESASRKSSGVAVAAAATSVTAFELVLIKVLSTLRRSCDILHEAANLVVWFLNH